MAANPSGSKTVLMIDGLGPLHIAVLEKFIPQFAPQAKVLFVRGSDERPLIFVPDVLQRLGVPIEKLEKLPDVVLHLPKRNLLILLELNTTVTTKQRNRSERWLAECLARREYVSALSDWQAFSRAGNNFAWDTHVWLAETPDHMIHCNGEKFLGPQRRRK
jgi:hypothetical protein